ncbi:MAG: hypothetical protein JNK64_40930 [Myxococcales bacterium]|nr:hypothetical protein [Myxococcales bacterium]
MTVAADRAAVLDALRARRDLADWSVRVVTAQRAWRRLGELAGRGTATGATLTVTLHRDAPAGRGTASFTVAAGADARPLLAMAVARADAALGPSWASPAPAAPARVDTSDPDVAADPAGAVDALLAALPAAELATADVTAEVADVELVTRRAQRAAWRETAVTARATLRGAASAAIDARARRAADLDLAGALTRARATPTAAPLPPGRYPVVLTAAALLHGDRGLLAAFVAQADPRLERQGLVRYRPGQAIGAAATLTLTSDGTLPFGWYSAPLGARGEAVRRFPLVNRGVAVGLGLDDREAALRGELPNGGVRGLVVPPGDADDDQLRADGALVIDALDWLEVEPTTGWFRAGFGGGTLRGDAIDLLGRARTSRSVWSTPTYRGPALWHLGPVAVD